MGNLIAWFDQQFTQLDAAWREITRELATEDLYRRPLPGLPTLSVGEYVVLSARVVEQTFGGITANLWDDPFEWTLPETLTTSEKLLEYFDEVQATRKRGFELFKNDDDLLKEIMTPAGETQLGSLLLDTLVRAGRHQICAAQAVGLLKKTGCDRESFL